MTPRESLAVVIGGYALIFAVACVIYFLLRTSFAWLVAPIVAAIVWREYVFTGMRYELGRLRAQKPSAAD